MSRSQIACVFDTGAATIVRVKSSGPSSFTMTMCRSISGGLDSLTGPRLKKIADKLSRLMMEWPDDPLALAFSPAEIRTMPTSFPAAASKEHLTTLCRMEAGFFLRHPDLWSCDSLPIACTQHHARSLEKRMLMFYPAEPAGSVETEMLRRNRINMTGLHFAPLAHLSAGMDGCLPVLELEERYTSFCLSRDGTVDYFMYWPVKNESEREYFAIRELTGSPLCRTTTVKVTGSCANTTVLKRIAAETLSPLEPLGLPRSLAVMGDIKATASSTSMLRAVSTALTALSRNQT